MEPDMRISETTEHVEIVQQNARGPGRIASRALLLIWGLAAIVVFLLAISAALIQRSISGEGPPEEIVATFILLLPGALVLAAAAMFELAVVLPRRLRVDADGIRVRFSTWPLPRPKFFARRPGAQAKAVRRRQHNYAIYPSGHAGEAPIVSAQTMIQYGAGRFGPVDADQAEGLAQAINAALARTAPGKPPVA